MMALKDKADLPVPHIRQRQVIQRCQFPTRQLHTTPTRSIQRADDI
jgi:hypothetical protein